MRGAFLHGENLRLVHDHPVVDDIEILAAWNAGKDTFDIAQKYFVPEWKVANRLTHIRMREREGQWK